VPDAFGVLRCISGFERCFGCQFGIYRRQNQKSHYKEICSGSTGHAEVVKITFDPKIITLSEILEVFFATHDPTTLNRPGADAGTQYRSAIFYTDENQKITAQK